MNKVIKLVLGGVAGALILSYGIFLFLNVPSFSDNAASLSYNEKKQEVAVFWRNPFTVELTTEGVTKEYESSFDWIALAHSARITYANYLNYEDKMALIGRSYALSSENRTLGRYVIRSKGANQAR